MSFGPLEHLYSTGLRIRRNLYRSGLARTTSISVPVISVGNLAVGGTGKTPFVIWLVGVLERAGVRVCVLSRGYRGSASTAKKGQIVGHAGKSLVSARVAGDEPMLIAQQTKASVVVGRDRVAASNLALANIVPPPEVFVLDDGFQHWRIGRDLDIVLMSGANPLESGRLLPGGRLREPASALRRADIVVLSGAKPDFAAVRPWMVSEAAEMQVDVTPARLRSLHTHGVIDLESLRGEKVALLSGIAQPERFRKTVESLGARVVYHQIHRDHAWLNERDIARFRSRSHEAGAAFQLVTAKDAVRIELDARDLLVLDVAIHPIGSWQPLKARLGTLLGVTIS
jgi:tetraacyldisaccharide 4'-kinase